MIAEDLINPMIPPLKLSDLGHQAISWMEEFHAEQLPVVDKGHFLGLIAEYTILDANTPEKYISDYPLTASQGRVYHYQHIYDIIKLAYDLDIKLVGVLDDEDRYLGAITMEDTLSAFAETAAVKSPGGILVLSMKSIDYSLAEISRLVEAEGVKVLNASLADDLVDPSMVRLTLKLNQSDLSRVIATLERFDYKIVSSFQEANPISNERERLDILMKYLDI